MSIPTLSLTDHIADKWADVLSTSTAIANWCASYATTSATIIVGFDEQKPPVEADCPYVLIFGLHKLEGLQINEHNYGARVGFCVKGSGYTTSGKVQKLTAMYLADAFGQLVYQVLAEAGECPVTQIDYQLDPMSLSNQYGGYFDLELQVPKTLGGSLSY